MSLIGQVLGDGRRDWWKAEGKVPGLAGEDQDHAASSRTDDAVREQRDQGSTPPGRKDRMGTLCRMSSSGIMIRSARGLPRNPHVPRSEQRTAVASAMRRVESPAYRAATDGEVDGSVGVRGRVHRDAAHRRQREARTREHQPVDHQAGRGFAPVLRWGGCGYRSGHALPIVRPERMGAAATGHSHVRPVGACKVQLGRSRLGPVLRCWGLRRPHTHSLRAATMAAWWPRSISPIRPPSDWREARAGL